MLRECLVTLRDAVILNNETTSGCSIASAASGQSKRSKAWCEPVQRFAKRERCNPSNYCKGQNGENMKRGLALFTLLTVLLTVPALASADGLTGTTVSGQFNIGGASTNYFDPSNFTDSTLTISDLDQPSAGALNWEMIFTDSAFAGASVSKVSDTFDNGGLSVNLVGDD